MSLLTDDIWAHPRAAQLIADMQALRFSASKQVASGVLARAGFAGDALDIALGVSYAESEGYSDAVGDLALIDAKWGPSIGLFQVRSLRNPLSGNVGDRFRFAWALLDPDFNALAAWVISQGGTDWHLWSTFTSGAYKARLGANYTIRAGHVRAADWGK